MPQDPAKHALMMREALKRKRAARADAQSSPDAPSDTTGVDTGQLQPPKPSRFDEWRDGPEGMIKWAEEHIHVNITPAGGTMETWVPLANLPEELNPETGRSYKEMWEEQKKIIREALVMVGGRFKHRLIILCWPRGEGKTYVLCYILMWKFFCWPAQELVLCANSKEQTKFVQFNIVKKIIENSPKLMRMVGRKNIQEKQIRLKDKQNKTVSFIKCVSSFSGILSNITGYAFSEIFQMKDPEFFNQIDGSIRNIVNAFGLIDSTVSAKTHILFKLFEAYNKGEDATLYYSYRSSKTGSHTDYWNPNQTQAQLKSFRIKSVFGSFERYFLNLWSHGVDKVFTPEQIDAMGYLGAEGSLRNHSRVVDLIIQRRGYLDAEKKLGNIGAAGDRVRMINDVDTLLNPVQSAYVLSTVAGLPMMASADALSRMGDLFDTDWAILTGMDRADPMKGGRPSSSDGEDTGRKRSSARTIFNVIAKGLAGSRSNPSLGALAEPTITIGPDGKPFMSSVSYIYLLLHLVEVEDHSIDRLKAELTQAQLEYDGIDKFTSERWAAWDLASWVDSEFGVPVELIQSAYGRQLAAFTEFYTAVNTGRFKAPPVAVRGSISDDILREEMSAFDHDMDRKWFGSPDKALVDGVQDDVMFSIAWTLYGGREIGVKDFRARGRQPFWGAMMHPKGLVGRW